MFKFSPQTNDVHGPHEATLLPITVE